MVTRKVWQAEWSPKDTHALIPGICEYATLHGKRDFEDVMTVMELNHLGVSNLIT